MFTEYCRSKTNIAVKPAIHQHKIVIQQQMDGSRNFAEVKCNGSLYFAEVKCELIIPYIPRANPTLVAKPHFPCTKIVISSDEKRRSSRSLPGPFAAEQPTDASYLSRVVRCAPASDEAPRGPNWQSINRRTRRPKFHDERPATPRCLLALPTEASSFP